MSNFNVEDLFSRLFISNFSFNDTYNKFNLYHGLAVEHKFKGIITDIVNIVEYDLNYNYILCAINFPYIGLTNDIVIDLLLTSEITDYDKIGGFVISINKFDLLKSRWPLVRDFLKQLDSLSLLPVYLAVDCCWIDTSDSLPKFFSIIEPYSQLYPVITQYSQHSKLTPGELLKYAEICRASSIKPVSYFGPPPSQPEFLIELLNGGFSQISVPGQLAGQLVASL